MILNIIIITILSILINFLYKFIFRDFYKNKNSMILSIFVSIILSVLFYQYILSSKNIIYLAISIIFGNSFSCILIYIRQIYKLFKTNNAKKYIVAIIFSTFLALIFETFVFNFRHFESLTYDGYTEYKTIENSNEIELKNVNIRANNMYIKMKDANIYNHAISLKVLVTDDGNELYYELPERKIYPKIDKSLYIKLNLAGKVHDIKLILSNTYSDIPISIDSITFNSIVPIWFNIIRFLALDVFLFIIFLIRPKSELYKIKCLDKFKGKKIIIVSFVLVYFLSFFIIVNLKKEYVHSPVVDQYQKLSNSILNGKLYLEDSPTDILKNMDNPYDTNLRNELNAKALWDHAYYNGKYYVYFGVVPVILFYIPCYLIFKSFPPMYLLVFFAVCMISIIFMAFLYNIIKRFFRKTSFITYLILSTFFVYSFGSIFFLRTPTIYFIPIAMGIMFAIGGLYFWLKSTEKNKLNNLYLFLGSLSMALVAGCRPQLLINAFLAIPIFYNKISFSKEKFKDTMKNILYFCLPFIIIAIFLMSYNYFRFGSFFDFGANYNLTTNDMTKRGIVMDRNLSGIFYLLFLPLSFSCNFPFLNQQFIQTNYMGVTISEPIVGSVFASIPLLGISFLIFFFRKFFQNKKLYVICLLLTIFSFIILLADIQMAGILQRYTLDFTWMLMISTIIIILNFNEKITNHDVRNFLTWIFIFLIIYTLIYNFLNIFISEFMYVGLIESRPHLFWYFYHTIAFWL